MIGIFQVDFRWCDRIDLKYCNQKLSYGGNTSWRGIGNGFSLGFWEGTFFVEDGVVMIDIISTYSWIFECLLFESLGCVEFSVGYAFALAE